MMQATAGLRLLEGNAAENILNAVTNHELHFSNYSLSSSSVFILLSCRLGICSRTEVP